MSDMTSLPGAPAPPIIKELLGACPPPGAPGILQAQKYIRHTFTKHLCLYALCRPTQNQLNRSVSPDPKVNLTKSLKLSYQSCSQNDQEKG